MQKLNRYSHIGLGLLLATGLAVILCVQCVRTFVYIGSVLVPQQAEREAERQAGLLTAAAHAGGISDPHDVGPLMQRAAAGSANVLWMRLLGPDNAVLATAGKPIGRAVVPADWWARVEKHESLGRVVKTPEGKALTAMLPFRLPPPRDMGAQHAAMDPHHRPGAYVIEVAIRMDSVAGAFDGLRHNVIFGLISAIALLAAVGVIGVRTPKYLRGKYLELELELARRVQSDLQPKQRALSPFVDFAAWAEAADHVGGDFHDVFETSDGKIAIVLGDVSGKGIPAALLVSVLHGAIRSSGGSGHEDVCERMNRMLCERTTSERFATLFWGVFDPRESTLRYVNAGHPAPMLIHRASCRTERLQEGGPVLGVLPSAEYAAGEVRIDAGDALILYSDGIDEAANKSGEEFGERRIADIASAACARPAREVCQRIMEEVSAFAHAGSAPDDRTLMVVRFRRVAAPPMAPELHSSHTAA